LRKAKHFLVVDDDPAARWLSGAAIEEADMAENIIFCKNGFEALFYIKENCLPTYDDPLTSSQIIRHCISKAKWAEFVTSYQTNRWQKLKGALEKIFFYILLTS
jgi:hypothetical protein